MTDTSRYATISKIFHGAGTSGSGAEGSGAGVETVVEAHFIDNLNLNMDVDLDGDEVVAGTNTGVKKRNGEMNLPDEEDDEQLVDYDTAPDYCETDEKRWRVLLRGAQLMVM